jgi:hypothetical protein
LHALVPLRTALHIGSLIIRHTLSLNVGSALLTLLGNVRVRHQRSSIAASESCPIRTFLTNYARVAALSPDLEQLSDALKALSALLLALLLLLLLRNVREDILVVTGR